MPWIKADVDSKITGLSDKQKEVWVEVANKALARCLATGRSMEACEGSAIRQANTVANGIKESMTMAEVGSLLTDFMDAEEPVVEAGDETELLGDLVPLEEKAVRKDGIVSLRLIAPGWGSSGYYPAEILERDGPKVFTPGVKMYWNHPTKTEVRERPERDLRDLAGELVSAARYEKNGRVGPGLYADAKVFEPFRGAVNELAPHIGVSMRAFGKAKPGKAEGRKGLIVKEINQSRSFDYVTAPGAGGQILELFESARSGNYKPDDTRRDNVTEQEAQALQEASDNLIKENMELKAENARLREAAILRRARDYVAGELAKVEMPDITRERLTEALSRNPPVEDGQLDEVALAETVEAGTTAELAYLAEVRGSGQIKGMGSNGGGDVDEGELEEAFAGLFRGQGLSIEEAERQAAFAADRR